MCIRKHLHLFISMASSILLTGGALTAGLLVGPTPASAATQITICLTSSSSFCADVKDSDDVSGQPIWLYSKASAHDFHWIKYTQTACVGAVTSCLGFKDAQKTSLCLGTSPSQHAVLVSCGTDRSQWIANGHHLRSLFWAEDLTTLGPLASGNMIAVAPTVGPGTNEWQQWSGF